jgi:four helix bundle protein
MDADEFKSRTRQFALNVIRLTEQLPTGRTAEVIGRQLVRSGTSVGANYRAAARAQSPASMVAKLSIVEEEADESLYWLDLLVEAGLIKAEAAMSVRKEASQILAMTVASKKTLKARLGPSASRQSPIVNRQSKA